MTEWSWQRTFAVAERTLPIGADGLSVSGTSPVVFPYDGSVVADAPLGDAAAALAAVDAAVAVRAAAAGMSTMVRREVLQRTAEWIETNADPLAELLVAETGKPLVDCRVEVARTALTWSLAAEEPARLGGETVPVDLLPGAEPLRAFYTRRPAGVVVGIAGFNYPLLLASHKIAPAVAAGCPVVVKPAPATPLATLALVRQLRVLLAAAGAPVAAVQCVTGDTAAGRVLTEDERVAVVSFTGSAAVGHAIAKSAAPRKVLLELGSNAALIVAADADLPAAADAVIRGGFYASGQACISVQRVIVEDEVYTEFESLVAERLARVQVGDPRLATTTVAALINSAATDRVAGWTADAVAAGAGVHQTNVDQPPGQPSAVLAPTVLTGVPDGAAVWDEEIFGPVVAMRRVADLTEAFAVANRSRYGLQAAIFTRSLATAFAAIDTLEVGGVIVNDVPGFRSDAMPYGGVKDSGIGREGPRWAVEEYTVTRAAVIRP